MLIQTKSVELLLLTMMVIFLQLFFSNVSNRWVLVYEDEDESDDEGEYEDESYDRQMYRMYLNMTKAVKDDRWTFTEYKAVVARDKARINNR